MGSAKLYFRKQMQAEEMCRQGFSVRKIAEKLQVSHTAVWKVLKKRRADMSRLRLVRCASCGEDFARPLSKIRPGNQFCCYPHFRAFQEVSGISQEIARLRWGEPLEEGQVLHFLDDDWRNSQRGNLELMNSQKEHVEKHHRKDRQP